MSQAEIQRVLAEVQQKYSETRAELSKVSSQIASKQQAIKIVEATEAQLVEQTSDTATQVWKGVGKMFLSTDMGSYQKELKSEKDDAEDQLKALGKKKQYLESTFENVNKAISEIISRETRS